MVGGRICPSFTSALSIEFSNNLRTEGKRERESEGEREREINELTQTQKPLETVLGD